MKTTSSLVFLGICLLAACSSNVPTEVGTPLRSSSSSSSEIVAMNNVNSDWSPDPGFFREESEGVFVHDGAKVRFRIPANVEVNVQDRSRDDSLVLSAYALEVATLDQPLGYGKENVSLNQSALAKGEFGPDVDFLVPESKRVVGLGDRKIKGKEFMVLSRFEVCDVTFGRSLLFYSNGYQVQLILQGPSDIFAKILPRYFTTDSANCKVIETNELLPVWADGAKTRFYADVSSGNTPANVNEWYSSFDAIVNSIEFL